MNKVQVLALAAALFAGVSAAPQSPQIPNVQGQQQAASAPVPQVAQSRDAAVYADAGGYGGGGGGGGGYGQQQPSQAYGAPTGGYGSGGGAAGGAAGGQPGGAAGNNGYYYYYYPVQESKSDFGGHGPKESYTATDSYGIDPIGIVAVLAIAGLVIAGLALLFPGWAYVKSDEHVYYRNSNDSGSLLGLTKEDYRTLMSLVLAAVEGEPCFERMFCDAGKLVKKVNKADTFLRLMEDFAPESVSGNIKKLRSAMKKPAECKNLTCSSKKKSSSSSSKKEKKV